MKNTPTLLRFFFGLNIFLYVKIYPGFHVGMVDGTGQLINTIRDAIVYERMDQNIVSRRTMRRLYHYYVGPKCMCLKERHM